ELAKPVEDLSLGHRRYAVNHPGEDGLEVSEKLLPLVHGGNFTPARVGTSHRAPPYLPSAPGYSCQEGTMTSTKRDARVAGLWYLLLVFGGPLRLIYIPNKLFVHDNAAATASNIAAHEWLFRLGMLSELAGAVILIFLTLAFYRLFKGVDQH